MTEELPSGWVRRRLGQLFEFKYGRSLPERTRQPGDVPVYGSAGQVGTHNHALTAGPTVIIGRKGSVGAVQFSPTPCWPIDTTYYIDAFNGHDPVFWAWILKALDLGSLDSSTAIPGINREDAYRLEVSVPPLAEQRRIVARIEALFARIRQARADLLRIAPLARLFRARVVAAAVSGADGDNWEQQTVADIADVVTGTTPPTNQRGHYGGQTPFVKPTDLDAGYFVETARETLTESGVAVSRPVPAGSTLLTCIGATIGKAGFARVGCTTNQQINALVPKPGCVEPRWLYRLVTSEAFQQQILANASATTLPIINKGRLKRLEIRVPPIAEQQKLADRVDALCPFSEAAEREATRALALLDHLERSILTRAFRGELVPQDPADEPASVSLARSQEGAPAAPRRGRPRRAA